MPTDGESVNAKKRTELKQSLMTVKHLRLLEIYNIFTALNLPAIKKPAVSFVVLNEFTASF